MFSEYADRSISNWLGMVDTCYRVSQPGADADRYRCACLTQGLAGRGDEYQCGLDWGRSSIYYYAKNKEYST